MSNWTKQETARFLNWSEKTLDRKTEIKGEVTPLGRQLGRHGGKGTGSHVTFSEQAVRMFAAQIGNTDGIIEPETIDGELSDNLDIPENEKSQSLQRSTNTGIAEIQKLDIGKNPLSEITEALILPHKLYVNLHEAKLLTGFPMTELHKLSVMKFGRRVIKKSKLEKL